MKIASTVLRGVVMVLVVLMCASVFLEWASAGPKMFRAGKLADRMIVVLYGHHEIHERNSFTVEKNLTLGSGDALTLLVNTPAAPNRIHMLITARGSGEGRYQVYKSPTVTALGVALEANNRDMDCTALCGVDITNGPTISNIGDEYEGYERHFGAGQQEAGESRSNNEIVLPTNTLVIINGISESANNDFSLELDFYVADEGAAP